jgi:FtsP/CotA-like multicopper oxidase with cupredoxin domain
MWTYGGTYPGLTLRRPTGQTTRLTFANNLPSLAGGKTVHHHGSHSASTDDGQVTGINFLFEPGQTRTYTYEGIENGENERGAMQWYHDHRMGETGMNVWMGLTGLFIIDDPADPQTLPSGAYDLPLVIADRQFDSDNQIQYFYDPAGVVGDKVLVNGVYEPYLDVADRKYRLRILNGANARIYILTLSTGEAFTQIGTESGLLPAPVARTAMDVGPAERLDVVVDFAGKLGQELYLMDAYQMVPLLKFRVTRSAIETSTVPSTLRALPEIGQPTLTRNFSFDFTSNHWTINGLAFDPNRIDARPVLGTTEKWVFTNPTGTTHMVHIHDVDQQCLSRDGGPCYPWETMKETWAVGPGETLELKMKFTDHIGIYMLHCHILEHEDDGMMTQFEVVAPPATAARTLNLSTRLKVDTGDDALIGGFIITGNASKKVLLRGLGPSLAGQGVANVLADPTLDLRNSAGTSLLKNDNWKDTQRSQIESTALQPGYDLESVIVATLDPGAYTVLLTGANARAGVGLIEIYDTDPPGSSSELANISARGEVQTQDNVMIGGLILGGSANSTRIVVLGLGPSLADAGLGTTLADPTLDLRDANGARLTYDDNWQDDAATASQLTSFGLAPKKAQEAAILIDLPPGAFTAILADKDGGTGVGLVEIYNLH